MKYREILREMSVISTHPMFERMRDEAQNREELSRLLAVQNQSQITLPARMACFQLWQADHEFYLIATQPEAAPTDVLHYGMKYIVADILRP